jgi:hypothetical protein
VWRHFDGVPAGYSVLITSGVASTYPGRTSPSAGEIAAADTGSGEGGQAWFRGGITYTVTDAERTILQAAGYEVVVEEFGAGFDEDFAKG